MADLPLPDQRETATTLDPVIFATEDDCLVHEPPDILTIAPRRMTLKFRSGRRARRLPHRRPFVSVSDLGDTRPSIPGTTKSRPTSR